MDREYVYCDAASAERAKQVMLRFAAFCEKKANELRYADRRERLLDNAKKAREYAARITHDDVVNQGAGEPDENHPAGLTPVGSRATLGS